MSLGPAGASLNPDQAENFEDVSFVHGDRGSKADISQMEKQFAVKGTPHLSISPSHILLTPYTSRATYDDLLGNTRKDERISITSHENGR